MGCESCSSGSCSTNSKDGLPPGMLQKYKLNIDRSDGFLVWIETETDEEGRPRMCGYCRELLGRIREMDGGRSRVWGVIFGHLELKSLYPEIYACIGCNACTKACTQSLNVMQYIAYAQRGDFKACAEESFDCVSCGCCSVRCPAGISHPMVGMLARRLNGKYLTPEAEHLNTRVEEIKEGKFDEAMKDMMNKPLDEIKELYNTREIEK